MNLDKHAPRLLGATFLLVVLTSLGGGLLFAAAIGSGSISDILVSISDKPTLMRVSILDQLVTSLGIVALAVLLYIVLNKQNRVLALAALGCWLLEAVALVLSQIGAMALIPLGLEFVKAGSPAHSSYQTLGEFLYYGVNRQAYNTIHMWFYCTGGLLWYYLFYRSRYIPRVISLYGLAAVSVSFVGIVFQIFGSDVPMFVSLPLLPFELAIGGWLVLRGIQEGAGTKSQPASVSVSETVL